MMLGMPYVELEVPPGSSEGIARFYREMLGTMAAAGDDGEGRHVRVSVGAGQDLVYRETAKPSPPYDGHHIAIYLADFSGPHGKLLEKGLVTEESDQHQYRFVKIIDPDSGKALFELEHEVQFLGPLELPPL